MSFVEAMSVQEDGSGKNPKKADEPIVQPTTVKYELTTTEEINNFQLNDTAVDVLMSVETILGIHITKESKKVFGALLPNDGNTILHLKSWNEVGSTMVAGLCVNKMYAFKDLKAQKKQFSRGNTLLDVKFTRNSSYQLIGNKLEENCGFVDLSDVATHVDKFECLAYIQKELREQTGQLVGTVVYGEVRVPVRSDENFIERTLLRSIHYWSRVTYNSELSKRQHESARIRRK